MSEESNEKRKPLEKIELRGNTIRYFIRGLRCLIEMCTFREQAEPGASYDSVTLELINEDWDRFEEEDGKIKQLLNLLNDGYGIFLARTEWGLGGSFSRNGNQVTVVLGKKKEG